MIDELIKNSSNFEVSKPHYIKDEEKLIQEIYNRLTPGWLRFSSVDSKIKQMIVDQVTKMVKNKQPIGLLNACGGFKNPRIDTSPHIDYAEVFHLSFYIKEVLLKIAEIYEPGMNLEYSGDAHMASYVDNLPKEWIDIYLAEFDQLIDTWGKKLPKNVSVTHKHFLDFYDYDELTSEIEEIVKAVDLKSPENKDLIDKYLSRAKSNFVVKGMNDYSSLSEKELDQILKLSVIKAYKWYELDFEKRGDYFSKFIPICNLSSFPDTYCVRSVRYMPAPPFWQGKGVIVKQNETFYPAILHVDQYLTQKNKMKKVEVKEKLINLQNLNEIFILEK